MLTLYHVSNPSNRDSILATGLVPQIGESQLAHLPDSSQNRVYLCEHNKYDSAWDDDRWRVDISHSLELHTDPDVLGCVYTLQHIPSECLTLIYEGSGKSTL